MSAFIVSDETITAIVQGLQRKDFANSITDPNTGNSYHPRTAPQNVGQVLLNQNYRSVNYRYKDNEEPHEFSMKYKTNNLGYRDDYTLGEMYGAVRCYMYQSCETPDWIGSDIYFEMCNLKDDLTEKMLEKLGEKMPWGI